MNHPVSPPPSEKLPLFQKLVAIYKIWHEFLPHVSKTARHTLGSKIDILFLELSELIFTARYLPREQKGLILQKATTKLDLLKFFLQILWEIKALDSKKYIAISEHLYELGRMLGGWNRQIQAMNSVSARRRSGE